MEHHCLDTLGPSTSLILDSISDAVFVIDPAWCCTYLNRAGARFARRTPAEVLGRPYWEVFPAVVGTVFETAARRAAATGEPVAVDAYSTASTAGTRRPPGSMAGRPRRCWASPRGRSSPPSMSPAPPSSSVSSF